MITKIGAWLAMPWAGFVTAFLYYVALTAAVLGGASPAMPVMAAAYAVPLLAYMVAIAGRVAAAMVGRAA